MYGVPQARTFNPRPTRARAAPALDSEWGSSVPSARPSRPTSTAPSVPWYDRPAVAQALLSQPTQPTHAPPQPHLGPPQPQHESHVQPRPPALVSKPQARQVIDRSLRALHSQPARPSRQPSWEETPVEEPKPRFVSAPRAVRPASHRNTDDVSRNAAQTAPAPRPAARKRSEDSYPPAGGFQRPNPVSRIPPRSLEPPPTFRLPEGTKLVAVVATATAETQTEEVAQRPPTPPPPTPQPPPPPPAPEGLSMERECLICYEAKELCWAMQPCGHTNMCSTCAHRVWNQGQGRGTQRSKCPACNAFLSAPPLRLFFA